jgi:hypothetical protein
LVSGRSSVKLIVIFSLFQSFGVVAAGSHREPIFPVSQ